MADFIGLSTYQELDPTRKGIAWANECITQFRRDWTRIFNVNDARRNREYLLSTYSTERVKKMFKDQDFKKIVDFIPIAVFENIKNIIASEITKFPPKVRLKAVDPTALQMKQKDIDILKNRKIIQGDLSKIQTGVGQPPYKIPDDVYQSNINIFDEMGLNEGDEDDLGIFKMVWHKLLFEIEGQNLINVLLKTNKFEETIKLFVNDILALKSICYQAYVSQLTGEIKFRHLFPEICYGLMGDRPDSADAICLGWQDTVTIRDFLDYVGNQFDWDRDWRQLLWAINFCNGQKYTGFIRNGKEHHAFGWSPQTNAELGGGDYAGSAYQTNLLEWNLAYNYKVFQGYIEWKSIDANSYKVSRDKGSVQSFTVPYNYKITDRSKYQVEHYYDEVTYCSTFLATSTTDQFLYGFGKLYHQRVEGQYDEYSNYSLSFYREEGISATEMAKPIIDLICAAFYKMCWAVYKAKPDSRQYQLEVLLKVSKSFDAVPANASLNQAGGNLSSRIMNLIQWQEENLIDIQAIPNDQKGAPAQLPNRNKKENGLDPIAIAMQSVVEWGTAWLKQMIGINDLREGFSPDPKDGYKINAAATISSRNATGYVDRLIQYTIQNTVNTATQLAQDIIRFKDSQPYAWLLRLIGDTSVKAIEQLDLFAAHRQGIFVMTYNSEIERQKIEVLANQALINKEITAEQSFLVMTIEDYEKAGYVLAYLKKKEQKRQQRIVQQQQQFEKQMAQATQQFQINFQREGKMLDLKKAQITADAQVRVAELNSEGKVEVKKLTIDSEPTKIQAKTQGTKEVQEHKADLEAQKAFGQGVGV
jgi:hypothetical protein